MAWRCIVNVIRDLLNRAYTSFCIFKCWFGCHI